MTNKANRNQKLIYLSTIFLISILAYSCSGKQKKEFLIKNEIQKKSNYVKAYEFYQRAMSLQGYLAFPITQKDSSDVCLAILYIDSALYYMPCNRYYLHYRGDLNLKLGKLDEALVDYKYEYITFDSTTNYFSFELGLLSYYQKEPDYLRYFENGLRVYKRKLDNKKLDRLQEFEYESRYIYSMFFVDSTESIKEYIAFRDKNYKNASYMFNFDLRECSKLDLVGYYIFHDTFNNTPPNKKRHRTY